MIYFWKQDYKGVFFKFENNMFSLLYIGMQKWDFCQLAYSVAILDVSQKFYGGTSYTKFGGSDDSSDFKLKVTTNFFELLNDGVKLWKKRHLEVCAILVFWRR